MKLRKIASRIRYNIAQKSKHKLNLMQLIRTPAPAFKSLSRGTNKAKNNNLIGCTLKNAILWLQKTYMILALISNVIRTLW